MNITKDIIGRLQDIDLSTEAAVVEKYEALANSLVLVQFLLHSNLTEVKAAYQASKENPEAIAGIFRDKLKEYATIGRTLSKRRTIKAIRRRIGLLFAEWEAEERAGGIPAKDGYLYAYAIEKGLDPDGASLSEADTAALDEVAECIFTTIEAYVIYSLTGVETAVDSLLSHKVGNISEAERKALREEAAQQISVLFASEWENAGDGLTTSCEEECNFFGAEATAYALDFLKALATDTEEAARFRKMESSLTPDEEEAASMEQAQKTKYKDYINANKPC